MFSPTRSEIAEYEELKADDCLNDVIGEFNSTSYMLHEKNDAESETNSSLGILKVDDLQGWYFYKNFQLTRKIQKPKLNIKLCPGKMYAYSRNSDDLVRQI